MLVFPQPVVGEEVNTKDEEELELRDQARSPDENVSEAWTTVAFRKSRYTGRGRSGARRDGRSYDNVVRGNKTWVSKVDLVAKWRPDCALVSDDIEGGDGVNVARANKGKSVVKEDEEFMEAKEENVEQIQFIGSRKRGRNSGNDVGISYEVDDVD